MTRRVVAAVICLLQPLALAAADDRGDAVACRGARGPGHPPDLVGADGWVGEEGSTAVWRMAFAEPLEIPETPFRVDVVVRDPRVPTISLGNYRRFNRIVRWDASSPGTPVELLFFPEGGHTLFDPPQIQGDTMTIQMPGRLLLGTDRFGRVDLGRLRWTVVVRDGGRCDMLGNGRTSLRLSPQPPPSASAPTDQPADTEGPFEGRQATAVVIVGLLVLVPIVVAAFVLRRRR